MAGVAGCNEHAFALFEALREAKEEQRQIVVSWIDLANAYGTVRHNLIQFALNWYHIPIVIQELIFNYYNQLCAKVVTANWHTDFFLFDIGLFQGCVLSTILFDCVFNLLLDYLQPVNNLGYSFKWVNIQRLAHAYADDLSIKTKTAAGNQIACDRVASWLNWTVTMRAKPKKCVQLGLKQFDKRNIHNSEFVPFSNTKFSPFDAKLTIGGEPMQFIVNLQKKDLFEQTHFKFLGRWLNSNLDELAIKEKVKQSFINLLVLTDQQPINGLMKLWLYQFYLLAKLSWPFSVQDFNLHFAMELQSLSTKYLKKWAKIFKSADIGILFRPKSHLGLGITSVSAHFKKMQLIKCHICKYSNDEEIRILYHQRTHQEEGFTTVWRGTKLLTDVELQVDHNEKFKGQVDKCGLGSVKGRYNNKPSILDHRKACVNSVMKMEHEHHIVHAHTLGMQGVWTRWVDNVRPFDLSWKSLIYGPGPRIISFILNASINSLPSPDLLKLMHYHENAECVLCGATQCTMFHILVGCRYSLTGKRYTFRHDSVLLNLKPVLDSLLQAKNSRPVLPSLSESPVPIRFVKQGSSSPKSTTHRPPSCLLDQANDWQLLIDFDENNIVFPPHICSTNQRPDIVIWSNSLKFVILIELTCPAEENIEAASILKYARYADLSELIRSNSWSSKTFTIEAGARGFVARSMFHCLRQLGLSSPATIRTCKSVSAVVARCSYAIWLARNSKGWKHDALIAM